MAAAKQQIVFELRWWPARRPAAIRAAAVSAAETKPSRPVIQVHSTAPFGAGVSSAFAEGPRLHLRCRRCHDVPGGSRVST